MKQEYSYQILALAIYVLSLLFTIHHNEMEFSGRPFHYIGLALYHSLLFVFVNYVLIPKFFSKKKMFFFVLALFLLIGAFAFVEETVIEQLLFPSRALDDFDVFDIYFFIGEVGIPLLVFMVIKLHFKAIAGQKRMAAIEKESLKSELKFLRSQIQPHVLFNSLNNLYEYTLSKSDKAPELVLQLSKVLRYVLYETDKERIPLKNELNFIREYVSLQETQLETRGNVGLKMEWKNPTDNLKIAPFVMIPFIENAFKHSLDSKEEGIEIDIELNIEETNLDLNVSNNYQYFAKTEKKLIESGIGLKNVKKRLELVYPNAHNLLIEDDGSTYTIHLHLSLEK